MADPTAMSDGLLILDLVLGGLRVRDARLNELAAEFLVRYGLQAVPRLVREATNNKNKPDHRVRALEVIARIGPPYPLETMDLALLLRTANKAVREAARNVLGFAAPAFGCGTISERLAELK